MLRLLQISPFSEFIFYELYRATFENSELGRMKKILLLREMVESFGLASKSMTPKRGRKSYFTPEGKVALMFLKMKTQVSFPKLMEELNGNIHNQLFCDILIDPLEQTVCETDCARQGSEERGVRGQVQQHPGGWDIVH